MDRNQEPQFQIKYQTVVDLLFLVVVVGVALIEGSFAVVLVLVAVQGVETLHAAEG